MTSYWPNIGQLKCIAIGSLVCVLAYHLSFVLYVIFFYRHYKQLTVLTIEKSCIKYSRKMTTVEFYYLRFVADSMQNLLPIFCNQKMGNKLTIFNLILILIYQLVKWKKYFKVWILNSDHSRYYCLKEKYFPVEILLNSTSL